jgi:hypothetical protein
MTATVMPFAQDPGRDATRDRPAPFDIAQYYYAQRFRIREDTPILRQLIAAVDRVNDLGPAQWAQWYSVALGFAPDLIVELGRGRGNSTALFAQAARHLGTARIISLCQSDDWTATVAPRIASFVDPQWFATVEARRTDILSVDFEAMLAAHRRVLVLWDAHGFEIAELVLGEILPRLANRDHLVLMHDISDNRYAGVPRSYLGQPLWKGSEWQRRSGADSRVNIGWMNSMQDQVIALADFAARNDLEIGSADHEYTTYFDSHPDRAAEMRDRIGAELFSPIGHWAFLSLSGKQGPFHFPAMSGWRAATRRGRVITDELPGLPTEVVTMATPWAYTVTFPWRPVDALPAGTPAWLRCRVHVDGGAIGVSLQTPDGTAFVDTQVVSSSDRAVDAILRVPDVSERGRLVIHTWDAPESARVRIEDVSLVW